MNNSISKIAEKDLAILALIEKECYKYFLDNNYSASYYQLFIHLRKNKKYNIKNYFEGNAKVNSYKKDYPKYLKNFELMSDGYLSIIF